MNVVVPYVQLEPGLMSALQEQKIPAVYRSTVGATGYWSLLAELWAKGETFIILEQDKIPAPGLLQELWECEHPWCTTPVSMRGVVETSPYPSLSCTKFDEVLMSAYPALLWELGTINFGYGLKEWSRLDLGISAFLDMEWDVHWHQGGRVEHRHPEHVDRDACLQ